MVSKEMENIIGILKEFQASTEEISVELTRSALDEMTSMVSIPKDVKCEPVDAGGVPAEWITTPRRGK